MLREEDVVVCGGGARHFSRERHREAKARVVPIIVRPSDWTSAPFGELQALPKSGKAVIKWRPQDDAWKNVTQELRRLLESLACDRETVRSSTEQGPSEFDPCRVSGTTQRGQRYETALTSAGIESSSPGSSATAVQVVEVSSQLRLYLEELDRLYRQSKGDPKDDSWKQADKAWQRADTVRWKREVLDYLDTNIGRTAMIQFHHLGTTLRSGISGAHVENSHEKHREFLTKMASEVGQGHVRVKHPPRRSGKVLPVVESFVAKPKTDY